MKQEETASSCNIHVQARSLHHHLCHKVTCDRIGLLVCLLPGKVKKFDKLGSFTLFIVNFKPKIQGLFKDLQGHRSSFSRNKRFGL